MLKLAFEDVNSESSIMKSLILMSQQCTLNVCIINSSQFMGYDTTDYSPYLRLQRMLMVFSTDR